MTYSKESREYIINGSKLICPICSHATFYARETLMNTPGMTLLGLEWANKKAQNYICAECGYILWFMDR